MLEDDDITTGDGGADGDVYEADGPVWDEGRVQRVR